MMAITQSNDGGHRKRVKQVAIKKEQACIPAPSAVTVR